MRPLVVFYFLNLIGNHCTHGFPDCCEGFKVPEKKCLLGWDSFVEYVQNNTWIAIYAILLDPTNIVTTLPQKLSIRLEVLPDLNVRRNAAYWNEFTKRCFYINETSSGGACTKDSRFDFFGGDVNSLFSIERVERYVSPSPDNFIIFSVCLLDGKTCNGLCSSGGTFVMVKDQRPNVEGEIRLNNISWCQIENTLNECFNMSLSNNSMGQVMEWMWFGENECKLGGI